jgi:two-component system, OmpR family, KDP operon response regulator KdpE
VIETAEPQGTILVIDDEPQLRRALESVFAQRGYDVRLAETGEQGLAVVAEKAPDVIVLDMMLPGISGIETARAIRKMTTAPILILSVKGSEEDKIGALDEGADDYLTKPFSTGELLARIRALLRRGAASLGPVRSGPLVVDLAKRRVSRSDKPVRLTRTEFEILATLVENADRVVTSKQLLDTVWGPEQVQDTQALRVHLSHLRRKIEEHPSTPRLVVTEPGVGYRFVTRAE